MLWVQSNEGDNPSSNDLLHSCLEQKNEEVNLEMNSLPLVLKTMRDLFRRLVLLHNKAVCTLFIVHAFFTIIISFLGGIVLYCIVVFQVRTNNTIMYFNKPDHPPQYPKVNTEVGD